MSRVKTLALATVVIFALSGCAQLFEFNLFRGLDKPPTPTAADYQGADGLDKLDEDLDSPAMVDALIESGIVDDILADLYDTYLDTPPLTAGEQQEAAILYADLALKTTEGEDLVNNIVEALLEGSISGSTIADILADIIPAEALADENTFTAMVEALLTANDAYLLLGESIDQAAPFGEADPGATLPPGALPGDIAQKSVVAYTMSVLVNAVEDYPAPGTRTPAQAIHELFLIATDDPAADANLADLTPSITEPDPILALADYAGYPLP
jgi:hypothetical protein